MDGLDHRVAVLLRLVNGVVEAALNVQVDEDARGRRDFFCTKDEASTVP